MTVMQPKMVTIGYHPISLFTLRKISSMKYSCIALAMATLLSACAMPGPELADTGFDKESYTPTGSLIARKSPERAAKQEVISGDNARDAIDRMPSSIPGR